MLYYIFVDLRWYSRKSDIFVLWKKTPENRYGLPDNTAMICYKFVLNFVYYLIFNQCENSFQNSIWRKRNDN